MGEVATIQKGLAHLPFNPNADSHQKFKKKLQLKISSLQKELPFIKF